MTPTPEEKAREIARSIAMLCGDDYPPDGAEDAIATAIREAVEAERAFWRTVCDASVKDARNAALEEAAKVVRSAADEVRDDLTYSEDVEWIDAIANEVLALKDKPT
jgi:hypothetical protein